MLLAGSKHEIIRLNRPDDAYQSGGIRQVAVMQRDGLFCEQVIDARGIETEERRTMPCTA